MKNVGLKVLAVFATLSMSVSSFAATNTNRAWQTGTLLSTEQTREREGSTTMTQGNATAKDKGSKKELEGTATSTTTENYETYEIYTIQVGDVTYTAREHLLFPWSKAADVTINGPVKVAIEKNKLYILDDGAKEHKASIVKKQLAKP